jgi:vitamin B12/bleomycin/antimicrobial peptide transport system ATP-binding/permease protein
MLLQDCFFLPQKPYMPLGSLRQQLLFPQSEADSQAGVQMASDAELRALAAQMRLPSAHSQAHQARIQLTPFRNW